ncbi:hypothetical protein JTB14_034156 [Gonioctena quinquepunctata]|nr:hypothetical protein JTB14_034156 [Gonioctena quinquepunctata]
MCRHWHVFVTIILAVCLQWVLAPNIIEAATSTITTTPTESTNYTPTEQPLLLSLLILLPLSTDSSYFTDTTYSTIPTHTTIPPTPHSTPEPTTTSIPTTTPAPVYVLSGTLRSVLWKPKQKETAIIEAEDGYKISVKIIKCEIDGISQEFVTLSTDEPNEGFLFTYNVTGEPSYIFNRNKIYAHFNGSEKSSFTANFSIIGEATTTTTTEITTSTQFLPTPSINDTADITVFLSGKNPADYKDQAILNNLKDAIRKMTTEYCENNFQLADEITLNNVKISMISACHSSWPNYETCSEITFGVPVNQKEISQWTGYQLNSHHLKIMWDRYHEKYLEDLYVYDIPDSVSWVRWQIVLFVVVTLLFLTGLLALRHISEKLARRSKSDDTDSILPESKRNSEVSLSQHYLQEIPPLFENAYPLYNVQVFPDEPFEIADEHKLSPTEDEEEENFKLKLVDGLGESGA